MAKIVVQNAETDARRRLIPELEITRLGGVDVVLTINRGTRVTGEDDDTVSFWDTYYTTSRVEENGSKQILNKKDGVSSEKCQQMGHLGKDEFG